MREVLAYLGLGANEGDRARSLRTAVERLGQTPGIRVLRTSSLRDSAFVGDGPPQADYCNGVVAIATVLPPHALLAVCKALELAAGRALPAPRNQPRPLDLDLLLYGDQRIDSKDLVVPHPRLFERSFALEPLRELGVDPEPLRALVPPRPRLVREPAEFAAICAEWREGGALIGLVPTMGALHRGHASLLSRARQECDRTAATIFVNPLQFAPGEDLAAYPRDLDGDRALCAANGVDVVFAPAPAAMYPDGFCSQIAVGAAATTMEGAVRPTHFSGVATVVARLFALANPHRAYFGEKDAQQVAVLRRLVVDLGFPLRLVVCPVVREADGLALSSRNVFLAADDRKAAVVLFHALRTAQQAYRGGERDRDALLQAARAVLAREPRAALDYLELRGEGDLHPLPAGPVAGGRLLVAARFTGGVRPVRLLDTMALVTPPLDGVPAMERP